MKILIQTDTITNTTRIKLRDLSSPITFELDKHGNISGFTMQGMPTLVLVDDVTTRRHDLVNGPHAKKEA
jgi:hypothetical protein